VDSKIVLAEDLVIDTNGSTVMFWAQRGTTDVSYAVLGESSAGVNWILLTNSNELQIETNVNEGAITSSPSFIFNKIADISNALVHEVVRSK
jgi:hypothetical protein